MATTKNKKKGGKGKGGKVVLIVESPAKARTIQKILKTGYAVGSSQGHVRDLPEKKFGVDIDKGFEPEYVIIPKKKKIISELKKLIKDAQLVLLATDEDREGEAIAWHLAHVLSIPENQALRAVFHEITPKAIKQAVANPRPLNKNLVNAQQARRILDRIVGYRLSPLLWRKIRGQRALSAGRVQSVAVRLIVEKEREIENFKPRTYFRIAGQFAVKPNGEPVIRALMDYHPEKEEEAKQLVQTAATDSFTITKIEEKQVTKSPPPPFVTSSLQQEAYRVLGLPVATTMAIAQKLYETGYITYMRTDSVHLSDEAINQAKQVISSTFGKEYSHPRQFQTKARNAQEAHEAIRPTDLNRTDIPGTDLEKKLYKLIWARTIASQMAPARIKRTTLTIEGTKTPHPFKAKTDVIEFEGFLKVYHTEETAEATKLPNLKENQPVYPVLIEAKQVKTKPPSRYSEATLVRELEKRGIGRPSTYAPTVDTIIRRKYVEVKDIPGQSVDTIIMQATPNSFNRKVIKERYGSEKRRLVPTQLAFVVNDYLTQQFPEILDYDFTAKMEDQLDAIARGEIHWKEVLKEFYESFSKQLEQALNDKQFTGQRFLGKAPDGNDVYARLGRYGPIIQIGTSGTENVKFLPLPPPYRIDTISLSDALRLAELPKELGTLEGKPVVLKVGPYGFYLEYSGKTYPVRNLEDPLSISLIEAEKIIAERDKQQKKIVKKFKDGRSYIYVIRDDDGTTYISRGRKRIPIPKDINPEKITLEQCKEILQKGSRKKN
ncbi:MAG: type I DNA topoisomerase [Chlorobi bacterium]|nr:type I DNA topoisomerase [Chlorobiota bacterium]